MESPDAVLASNTSSIPIMKLAMATGRPSQVIGIHFFNPVPVLPLVELVTSLLTSDETAAAAERFATEQLGKQVIRSQDRAGFIVNALLIPYILSAVRMLESGFATADDIDLGMVKGCAHPMGPLAPGRPHRARHHHGRGELALRGVQGAALRPAAAVGPHGRGRAARPQVRPRLLRLQGLTRDVTRRRNDWVERDAAVVWHGFTQMGAYADNAPLVIDRAEGRELIDVEGRRYLDAISSLWVNTLGHRVPELDAALAAQAGKVAHSTMLGNGNTVVIELAEALAAVVPVDAPHFLFAADGAVAVEQALKIAFQYWVNRGVEGRTHFLALGDAYHGDTIGSLSLGDGGVFSAVFEPLVLPCPAHARVRRSRLGGQGLRRRRRPVRASWPPSLSSRWSRGPRACCAPRRRMCGRSARPAGPTGSC